MKKISEHVLSQQTNHVLKISSGKEESQNYFFKDSLEHLQALEHEARLRLVLAYLNRTSNIVKRDHDAEQSEPDLGFAGIEKEKINKQTVRELLQQTVAANRTQEENSLKKGIDLNFVNFCETYNLDGFERFMTLMLFANYTCVDFRNLFDSCGFEHSRSRDGEMSIGTLLSILCDDYREQIGKRKYFSINGTIIKQEIVVINCHFDDTTNILDVDVILHERIVRYILGDNNMYDISMQCISRVAPTVTMDRIILPERVKNDVATLAINFSNHMTESDRSSLRNFFGYGTGLVFLFYGSSGTGKTMLAHALANMLGKELLSLNVGALSKMRVSFEDAIKHIFKEARLTGAIVFFDECDDLIKESTDDSRELLIEIEKAECLTILATNRVINLDPAFDRRITMKVPFEVPDSKEREKIWNSLLPGNVSLSPDVNLQDFAQKYIFTGGLIKNVLLMAINNALKNNNGSDIVLSKSDIEKAAEFQAKSMFADDDVCSIYAPNITLEGLPLRRKEKTGLQALSTVVKNVLVQNMGINVVIGSSDILTGIECVEAIAHDCKLNVKRFSFAGVNANISSEKIKDPFSHKEISVIDYAFKTLTGYQALTLFVDYEADFEKTILDSKNETSKEISLVTSRLRFFKGVLFIVTKPIKDYVIPAEFHQYMEISFPAEELQIRKWEKHLHGSDYNEKMLIDFVERNPLHLHEIDFVARQAGINAIVHGRKGLLTMDDISESIGRYKRKTTTPVLFGNR